VVTTAQVLTGVAGVVLGPVIAAIALGLVGPRRYAAQTGRMAAFNHAGNVVGSTVAGLAGYLVSLRLGFWLASPMTPWPAPCGARPASTWWPWPGRSRTTSGTPR
jgi:MFS family permease